VAIKMDVVFACIWPSATVKIGQMPNIGIKNRVYQYNSSSTDIGNSN